MSNRQNATHAYAGFCTQCGNCVAVSVDAEEYAKDNGKLVAGLVRKGRRVERITIEEARKSEFGCNCPKKKAAPKAQLALGVS